MIQNNALKGLPPSPKSTGRLDYFAAIALKTLLLSYNDNKLLRNSGAPPEDISLISARIAKNIIKHLDSVEE